MSYQASRGISVDRAGMARAPPHFLNLFRGTAIMLISCFETL